jgi:hypothetical protein
MDSHNFSARDIENSTIAVGKNARSGDVTIGVSAKSAEASRLLDELIATLTRCGDESQGVRDIQELAMSAKGELTSESPDKARIDSLLRVMKTLLANVGSAVLRTGDLAGAIDRIRGLLGHL